MPTVLLIFTISVAAMAARAQDTPADHHHEMMERGNQVMGFSQDATTHHFRLFEDGGAIEVTANSPDDVASRDQIRMHLQHIVKMFAAGNFNAPMLVHATNPPDVATLTKIPDKVSYRYQEIPQGGEIRITTADAQAVDAIHAFMLFQIIDHRTGDSPAIADKP
jgi:hypothetical protein